MTAFGKEVAILNIRNNKKKQSRIKPQAQYLNTYVFHENLLSLLHPNKDIRDLRQFGRNILRPAV